MSRPPLQWWVRANNRGYGPYPSERLPGFVREGRLTPETSVANDPSGPWWPAGRNPSLDELFAAPSAEPPPPADEPRREPARQSPAPVDASAPWPPTAPARLAAPSSASARSAPAPVEAPAAWSPAAPVEAASLATRPQPAAAPVQATPALGGHAFVVFAELLDGREARFAAILARLGAAVRARPGVWLLRAGADAAAVRNALSQALGEGESLMVVRAEAADAAWFNLGGEADRALRGLWLQPTARSSRA